MKQIINDYYLDLYPEEFKEHFRESLNEEYLSIFNSISTSKGNSQFHYDRTMIPAERFEKLLRKMVRAHIDELIRLAIIGFRVEKDRKKTCEQTNLV